MKNKTLKNLIAFGALAVFVFGVKTASASIVQPYNSTWTVPVGSADSRYYYQDAYIPNYYNVNNGYNSGQYGYNGQYSNTNTNTQVQYVPVETIKYVQQPAKTEIKYVPVETVKYVNTGSTTTANTSNTQSASVVRATSNTGVYKNTGVTGNTGQYVSYEPNGQGMMLASAYGAYNNVPTNGQVVYDNNGVTALTVRGSGGFMPTSVFQWFLLVLIILAIVIVARMVSKTFSHSHGAPAAHH